MRADPPEGPDDTLEDLFREPSPPGQGSATSSTTFPRPLRRATSR
jgi:hypothetical protein